MNSEQQERFFDHLDRVDRTPKELDAMPEWTLKTDRLSGRLMWHTAVKLNGRLGGGVSIRLTTPTAAWERDVYGHTEVVSPATLNRQVRINPVEWKPMRAHRNPPFDNDDHSLATYLDRWHPYELNRSLNPDTFFQKSTGIALPLPVEVDTFSDYLHFCGTVWKCPSIERVPTPPWSPQLV